MTCLFILSGIEGILESLLPWFPYRLLYKGTKHISPSNNQRRKSELKDLQIEMHELKKKNSANLKIEMIDLRKNLTAKEDELLATKELLLKEESTPGPKISCVEDPLLIQSKQSDLDCSVEAIESQNENSSQQQNQEKSLGQGNLLSSIDNKTVRRVMSSF